MRKLRLILAIAMAVSTVARAGEVPPANGLALWIRADAGVTTDAKHDLTAWLDQSGHNEALTIVGAPSLRNAALNGAPAVVFRNGAYLKIGTPIQALSWIGVYKVDDDNLSDRGVAMVGTSDQFSNFGNYRAYMYGEGGTSRVDGNAIDMPTTPVFTGEFHLMDWSARWDRPENSTLVDAVAADNPGLTQTGSTTNGELAELLVYNRQLTRAEIASTEAYLAGKYGISLSHPVITLSPGHRQNISGFGASMLGDAPGTSYNALSQGRQDVLAKVLWGDGKLNTLRLWEDFAKEAPDKVTRNYQGFENAYVTNGLISRAVKNGVTNLLLSPDGPPAWCTNPADGQLETDQQASDYAGLIVELIDRLHQRFAIAITITGVANECPAIAVGEWPVIIKNLRAGLDAKGYAKVKITAPEWANNDEAAVERLVAIRNDPVAWADLFAPSTHSYSMPAQAGIYEEMCQGQGREFWEDECGGDTAETPSIQGQALAAHVLSDVNHGVSNWVWFIGAHVHDPNGEDGMRLLLFDPAAGANWLTIQQKYYYFQQISQAFDTGAIMRLATSSIENMQYGHQYGYDPLVNAIGGQNPDGTWAAALVNNSGGDDDGRDSAKAETLAVDVVIPELAGVPSLTMAVRRSGPGLNNVPQPNVTLKYGVTTVNLGSTELVTLRSTAPINVVEPVVISPSGGTYVANPPVTLSCATEGATIHYTMDGTAPSPQSAVYSAPFTLPANAATTVRTMAVKKGLWDSLVSSAGYDTGDLLYTDFFSGDAISSAWYLNQGFWRVRDGVLSQYNTVSSGGYKKWAALNACGVNLPEDVTLEARVRVDSWGMEGPGARAGISLFNQRDGGGSEFVLCGDKNLVQLDDDGGPAGPSMSFPWTPGTWYWMKLRNLDGDLTAKVWPHGSVEPAEWMLTWKHGGARAGFPGLTGGGETGVSASFADFSLRAAGPIGTVETPTIGLASGTYIAAQKIALSCGTDGAVIRYTLDSSEPNARSLRYYPDNPISIGAKNTVLKVKAIRPGLFDSKTVTATYHVLQNVSIPVFAPGEGNYTAAQSIAISSPTAGAVIHYTTDGTEPTEASPVATGPIALNASTILKARAFAPDMNASLVAAGTYQLIRFGPELHKEDFQAGFPGAAWTTSRGSGSWGLNAGALVAIDDVGVWDTNKAILNKTERAFPDDLSISARLRVDKWVPDSDASRAGIALGAGIADGRGYNLIFFKDQATLAMLDDGVAWGPKFNFPWKTGTWYRLRLASYRGVLHGRVWADGSPEPDTWQLNWARTGRVGFPALNGGYSPGQAVSFDQVKVEGTSALSGR